MLLFPLNNYGLGMFNVCTSLVMLLFSLHNNSLGMLAMTPEYQNTHYENYLFFMSCNSLLLYLSKDKSAQFDCPPLYRCHMVVGVLRPVGGWMSALAVIWCGQESPSHPHNGTPKRNTPVAERSQTRPV